MRSFLVLCCVFVSAVAPVQGADIAFQASSAVCDIFVPDWGSIEPRVHSEFGREMRLAGGAWIAPKREVETSFEFRWYPEQGPSDSLFVAVATDGEFVDGLPMSGLIFEIRSEGQAIGTVAHPGEDRMTIQTPVGRIPGVEQIVSHVVRIERREKDDVLECELYIDGQSRAILHGNRLKLAEGKRIAIGNRGISRNAHDERVIPVSFISNLRTIAE